MEIEIPWHERLRPDLFLCSIPLQVITPLLMILIKSIDKTTIKKKTSNRSRILLLYFNSSLLMYRNSFEIKKRRRRGEPRRKGISTMLDTVVEFLRTRLEIHGVAQWIVLAIRGDRLRGCGHAQRVSLRLPQQLLDYGAGGG